MPSSFNIDAANVVALSSSSSSRIRRRASASSSASRDGMPGVSPASIRACRRHRDESPKPRPTHGPGPPADGRRPRGTERGRGTAEHNDGARTVSFDEARTREHPHNPAERNSVQVTSGTKPGAFHPDIDERDGPERCRLDEPDRYEREHQGCGDDAVTAQVARGNPRGHPDDALGQEPAHGAEEHHD